MKSKTFLVTLESDTVVSSYGATIGSHECLDYIPGSAFLGWTAFRLSYFPSFPSFDPDLLLSGKLRFGNAYPVTGSEATMPVPLSYHRPKTADAKDRPALNGLSDTPLVQQAKAAGEESGAFRQLREGFMTPDGKLVKVRTRRRMMTELDRERLGASKESRLFEYAFLPAGSVFRFTLEADDDLPQDRWDAVVKALTGKIRIGRSRNAEFGLASCAEFSPSAAEVPTAKSDNLLVLYLLSDLCLLRDGAAVLAPTAKDLDLPDDAQPLPEKTFVRVRSYSPWNSRFNCRQTERQVIRQGSVLAFRTSANPEEIRKRLSRGIGLYTNEGLGRVLVNPSFVLDPPVLKEQAQDSRGRVKAAAQAPASPLIDLLRSRRSLHQEEQEAMRRGQQWADRLLKEVKHLLAEKKPVPTKSQWADLRTLAAQYLRDLEGLRKAVAETVDVEKAPSVHADDPAKASQTRTAAFTRHRSKWIGVWPTLKALLAEKDATPLTLYHCADIMRKTATQRQGD